MKKIKSLGKTLSLSALTLLLTSVAFAEESKVSTTAVDANGVEVDTQKVQSKSKTMMGNTVVKSKESVTVDPKGMNNKVETSHTVKNTMGDDGSFDKKDSKMHSDGTSEVVKNTKSVSNHMMDDGKTVTTTNTKTVDPVGLGNKATIQNKVVEKDDGHGSVTKTVTGKVNGNTVLENSESNTK